MPTSTAASHIGASGSAGSPKAACSGRPGATGTHLLPAAVAWAAVPVLASAPPLVVGSGAGAPSSPPSCPPVQRYRVTPR